MKNDFGRGKNRGCDNGRIFISTEEPITPINKDMWINSNALNTLYVKKSSTTSRASTTVLADDPDLLMLLPKNGVFEIDFYLHPTGNTSGDIKINFDLTGGVTAKSSRYSVVGMAESQSNGADCTLNLSSTFEFGVTAFSTLLKANLLLETGSTGGYCVLQWAQATSNATATVLSTTSYMIARQLAGNVSLLKWYSESDSAWKFII